MTKNNDIYGAFLGSGGTSYSIYYELEKQEIIFESNYEKKINDILSKNFNDIIDNKMYFNVKIINKKIQPLELFFNIIKKKKFFNLKISRSNYNLYIIDIKFISIDNLLSKNLNDNIIVNFEYSNIEYENNLLTTEEKRCLKIKKIYDNLKCKIHQI
jgi:hypothetical protein